LLGLSGCFNTTSFLITPTINPSHPDSQTRPRHRSVLSEIIPACDHEELLSLALSANDELSRALTVYEELAATQASRSGGGAAAAGGGFYAAAAGIGGVQQQLSGGGAGPALPTSAGGGVLSSGTANFSLLDEGEEEEAAELLTNRVKHSGSAAPLIDLSDVDMSVAAGDAGTSAAGAASAPPAAASSDTLEEGVAKLGLGGDGGSKPAQS